MKTIDAHIHLFERPWSDLFDNSHIKDGESGELHLFERYREKFDIEAAFVVCYDEGHCPQNTAYVERLMANRPWIRSFGYARPDSASFANNVLRLFERAHFGVSCYLKREDSGEWLSDPAMTPAWNALAERNAPLSLSIHPHQCQALKRALRKLDIRPTVLVNHMGRPPLVNGKVDATRYQDVLDLAAFENVFVKLSGGYAFSSAGWSWPQSNLFHAMKLLKSAFGTERLLFASDFSPVLEFNTYKQTLELPARSGLFSASELEDIRFNNAARLVNKGIELKNGAFA